MPYLDSNIPSKIFYSTIGSEVLRFARTTTSLEDFIRLVNSLFKRMHKQGCKVRRLVGVLNKMFDKHFHTFRSFASTAENFVRLFTFC